MGLMGPLIVAVILAVAPTGLSANERAELSISPARVTIGPDTPGTQTIHISGNRNATIVFTFDPGQPPGGFASSSAYRRSGGCNRTGPAEYTCTGYGDVTLTYPAYPDMSPDVDGTSIALSASAPGSRVSAWIDLEVPPPPTTEPPEPTETPDPTEPDPDTPGATEPGDPGDPPASDEPGDEPTPEPAPEPTDAEPEPTTEPPAEPGEEEGSAGSGLTTAALLVGGPVGLAGLFAGAVALYGVKRRRAEGNE